MKKIIEIEYSWYNKNNKGAKIPVHHETELMGRAEKYILDKRKGLFNEGTLQHVIIDAQKRYYYIGQWSYKFEIS